MEFGDGGRHSSQLSNYFSARNCNHEEKLKEAVMELFSQTYCSKSNSSVRFESIRKERIMKKIEARLPSMFPAIFDVLPNHPPYAVMVMEAIRGLNEKKGSKMESISKYIKEHYENLPWAHPAILQFHLGYLVETGEILFVSKSCYRLPESPDPEPNPRPKHEQQPKSKSGEQVVRSLYENDDDDGWVAIPKSKRTRVVEVECVENQMPGVCLRPEQVGQQKTVEKSGFNEDVVIVDENDPLKLTIKLKSKSRGRGRPPKKRDAEQAEQQKPVGETESSEDRTNQQPTDGMQVETEAREDSSVQNTVLGSIVENETNHNGFAGIEEIKEQPPVEEGDIDVDLSNHHSMGMEVENQTDEGGSNHHVTVGTEAESENNDDGTKQHLMIEQGKEQQLPVEKIDTNEDGSVVFEHVEQQLVVEGSDTYIKEDGSSQHPTGGIEVGTETREDVSKLRVTVGTEVEWETTVDCLKQHLTNGIEYVEEQPLAENPDANEDVAVVIEHLDQPQPVVEGSDFNEVGSNQHQRGGIEVGTKTKEDVLKLHVTVGTEVGWETNDDCLEQHLKNGIEQVEQQLPAEKPDVNEDGSVVIDHVEQPQPVVIDHVEGSDINEVGSNQHPTGGVEVGTEANKDENLHITVDAAVGTETSADGLRQHLIDGIEQVEQPPAVEKLDSNEDGSVGFEQVEEHQPVEGSGVSQDGLNQHPTFGIEKQDTEQVELPKPVGESKSNEDGMNQHPTSGIEGTPLQQVNSGRWPPEKNKLRMQTRGMARKKCILEQQQAMSVAVEPGDGNDAKVVVAVTEEVGPAAVTKEEEPKPVRQTRGMARKKCILEQQQAISVAVEPRDGNDAKVVVAVTEEVGTAAVTKEEEPKPVRQTRGMARKKCILEQQQAMSVAVEPGDGNDAKVVVAVTEEVGPVAVTKEEEPKPVRQTRGMARKKCTPEQQQAMSDAVELREGDGAKVEVAVTEEVDPMDLTKEEEPRTHRQTRRAPKVCAPEQQQQAMSNATEPMADNDATVEVAVKEDEGKLHLRRRGQGGQGRGRSPMKHVRGPEQEEEIIVVVEEEQKPHGRGGRQRGIGREETIVLEAEKVQKPYVRGGRQRGRGQKETMVEATEAEKKPCGQGEKQQGRGPQETVVAAAEQEKKPCGQGGKQRGRGPKETVLVVEEEEQKSCGQGRGRERGREETMQRKRNKTHVDEDKVESKQWWQKSNKSRHVDKEEVEREVEGEERP